MKKISCCSIFIALISFACQAQEAEPEILSVFKVSEAWYGKKNVSARLRRVKAYTMFYKMQKGDTVHYMANVWPKTVSQSFGPMIDVTRKSVPAAAGQRDTDYLYFDWHYLNSYDLKQGVAKVSVEIEYKPSGVFFTVSILPEDRELIVYKGMLEK